MSEIIFRDTAATGRRSVFRSELSAPVSAGATAFMLKAGDGARLPSIPSGKVIVLRLGLDAEFDPVVVTGRSGDVCACLAVPSDWPAGTLVIAAAMAEVFESFVQRGEIGTASSFDAADFVQASALGATVATLVAGTVPATQLPSYVDDVLEFADLAAFPATGEQGKIYVAIDSNLTYRWSGSVYVQIVSSPGSTDSLAEGTVNLYYTTVRVNGVIDSRLASIPTATTGTNNGQAANTAFVQQEIAAGGFATAASVPSLVPTDLYYDNWLFG